MKNKFIGAPDEELQRIVRHERIARRQGVFPTIDDYEESEAREDQALARLSARHPLGQAGQEMSC